ncbi:MAG: hypothetical protein V1907_03180 [Candidatus Kerfeldbacteria bacterium]
MGDVNSREQPEPRSGSIPSEESPLERMRHGVRSKPGLDTSEEPDVEEADILPAAAKADAEKQEEADAEKGKEEESGAPEAQSIEADTAGAGKPRTKKGGRGDEIPREVLEGKQSKVASMQERQEKKKELFDEAKRKFIVGVRETRNSVHRLREEYIRQGRTEEEHEKEAQKLVEQRASRFEHSDMELIVKKLLRRITIPHAETTKAKFAYLVGLGMNRDLPGGKLGFWSKENYLHLFAKKAGKKMEDILDEERQTLEADYNALDEALAQLEQETAPEEETAVEAAA